ncbi:MAG: FRG domain-containing protein [Alphaproteobacteria bacterium]|nr:FRG domain-containing protein [Alphaproteobacteria bacterium]MDE2163488.1 FRG domain-containing protein [Alphaproteobacteria bacterium]
MSEFVRAIENKYDIDDTLFRGQAYNWDLTPRLARIRPREKRTLTDTEANMFREFQRQAIPFLNIRPESDWDWLSVARHHGMPTRLLDWSSNSLAALWFAVKDPCIEVNGRRQPAVVWAFECKADFNVDERLGPFDQTGVRTFRPKHINPRIIAQAGWFTVHPATKLKELRSLRADAAVRKRLTKFVIAPDDFSNIRFELDRCGVNAASLIPDLDGVCRQIEFAETLLPDE